MSDVQARLWAIVLAGGQGVGLRPLIHQLHGDTESEAWALQEAYAFEPTRSFPSAFLEHCPPSVAVSRLPALTWSDWGTPEQVVRSLRRAKLLPSWLAGSEGADTPLESERRFRA